MREANEVDDISDDEDGDAHSSSCNLVEIILKLLEVFLYFKICSLKALYILLGIEFRKQSDITDAAPAINREV